MFGFPIAFMQQMRYNINVRWSNPPEDRNNYVHLLGHKKQDRISPALFFLYKIETHFWRDILKLQPIGFQLLAKPRFCHAIGFKLVKFVCD